MKAIANVIGFLCLLVTIIFLALFVLSPRKQEVTQTSFHEEIVQTDWKSVFEDNGFSEEEIVSYGEMFDKVGVTDFHDVEIIENGTMHIVRGKIYDSKELQLNVTLENRKIILIELAGLPATDTEAYINWRGNLKFRTVDTTKSIDLYYDVDGGYQAALDWENKMITAIE